VVLLIRLSGGARAGVAEFDALLGRSDLDDALDEKTGRVDVVGIEFIGLKLRAVLR
jgi:hypothetical protein